MLEAEVRRGPQAPAQSSSNLEAAAARALEAVLWLTLVGLCASAFVGLAASGYWVDELWTLWVADPAVGAGEVVRRTLMDAHPPVFYLALHGWMRLVGDGEAAARSFSAICAVGACAVFVATTGKAYSRPARLFAAIAGAGSLFWFEQSQNLRSYALAILMMSALLGCALEARAQALEGRPGRAVGVALGVLGLLGAFVHFYLFLAVGLTYLALIVSVRDLRLRLTLVAWGCAIAAAVLTYIGVQRGATIFTQTWFTNDPGWLAASVKDATWSGLGRWSKRALVLLLAVAAIGLCLKRAGTRGPEPRRLARWLALTGVFIALGTSLAGLAISLLLEPSFSGRNLLVTAPALWCACAWIYDEAMGAAPRRLGLGAAAAAALASALNLSMLDGRMLNRREDWRGSGRQASMLAACRGRPLPVIPPALFAPDTPFYRRLAAQAFFGRYYDGGGELLAVSARELGRADGSRLARLIADRGSGKDPCPLLAWGVHDLTPTEAAAIGEALAQRPDVSRAVMVRSFPDFATASGGWRLEPSGAYLFELKPDAAAAAPHAGIGAASADGGRR